LDPDQNTMKIACITSSQIPSSTANSIQAMKVCHALAEVADQVRLWVPGSSEAAWETLANHYGLHKPFEIHWEPSQQLLKRYDLAFKAVQQARSWGAQLVYTWMPQAAVMALMQHIPAILEMHDLPTGRMGPHLFRQFIQQRNRKRMLAITHSLLKRLEDEYHFKLSPDEVQIAPNGTDCERYENLPEPEEARRLLNLRSGFTVGYTGHFYSGRGVELMIQLVQAFPDINFLFVGGQPEKVVSWQGYLQQSNIRNAHMTGFVENARLPLYQAAADILLMPYEQNIAGSSGGNSADICSPMKMFDYMAAGRAIITSDLPVIREVLNENNAVFCAPEENEAWGKAIEALIANPQRCAQLGAQARKDAGRYSWRGRAERALEGLI
jgi:glycosyltransferase involved in cell wall biosynthesis